MGGVNGTKLYYNILPTICTHMCIYTRTVYGNADPSGVVLQYLISGW